MLLRGFCPKLIIKSSFLALEKFAYVLNSLVEL